MAITFIVASLMIVYPTTWLLGPLAGNAAGVVGDVWMVLELPGYPPRVQVDTIDGVGVGVYSGETNVNSNSSAVAMWNVVLVPAGQFTALMAVLLLAVVGSFVLGIGSFSIGDPDTIWHLLTVERNPDGLGVPVGCGFS